MKSIAAVLCAIFSLVSPCLGLVSLQEKVAGPPAPIVFEMTTTNWGVPKSDGCKRRLDLRLYANGKIEYEECRNETTSNTAFTIRKETTVQRKEIEEFLALIEDSRVSESRGSFHSGLNLTDVGWNTTLTFNVAGKEKRLEIRNYVSDSKNIPDWLHEIMRAARRLIPPSH